MKQRIKPVEGAVYALPAFSSKRWFVLVARFANSGILGFFASRSTPEAFRSPKLIRIVGDLGIRNGEWIHVGDIPNWQRSDWPMPKFLRKNFFDPKPGVGQIVEYNDRLEEVAVSKLTEVFEPLPDDGVSGHKAIEVHLRRIEERDSKWSWDTH
jgi:hypothetical protein